MLKRTFCNRTFLQVSQLARFSPIKKFSQNVSNDQSIPLKKEGDIEKEREDPTCHSNEEKLKRLLDEAVTNDDSTDKNWATSPYPADTIIPQETEEARKPNIDPKETSVVIFPGQGTIKVGTIRKYLHFPGAKDIFEIANEILGYNLLKICLEGPQKKLDETKFNQPATVVSSLAALEKMREERPKVFETCVATAGYSVGELSSLIFSGAISLEDGIRLVAVRGEAMQEAANRISQGMLSVYCSPKVELPKLLKEAEAWAQDLGISEPVCKVSIYLCTQTKILAGNEAALNYIEKHGPKVGLSKIQRLPVSGAFHTTLMAPALKRFSQTLDQITFEQPRTTVYSNYTGNPYRHVTQIKKLLCKQIVSPVKWEQCMQKIFSRKETVGFPRTFDVGSNGRMKTILKLINLKAANSCIVV